MRVRPAAIALVVGAALALAACGDDDAGVSATEGTTQPTVATETTPVQPTGTGSATATETTGTVISGTTTENTGGADANGGEPTGGAPAKPDGDGGDEERMRAPVVLKVAADGSVSPATVTVPAFFDVQLTVDSPDRAVAVVAQKSANSALRFNVPKGKPVSRNLGSLRPGNYRVIVSPGSTVIIRSVSGGAAGP